MAITIGTATANVPTVIKQREPVDRTTVIKTEHDDGRGNQEPSSTHDD